LPNVLSLAHSKVEKWGFFGDSWAKTKDFKGFNAKKGIFKQF
jgi:hypothetical protein